MEPVAHSLKAVTHREEVPESDTISTTVLTEDVIITLSEGEIPWFR